MCRFETAYAARVATYESMAARLSSMSDRRLGDLLRSAPALGSGLGGRSAEVDVEGTRAFLKRVPLTDLEARPENIRSTANLFGLPMSYQYGAGSAGFGAWRELAAHTMANNWVLGRQHEGFPLMYHWRVLADSAPEGFVDEFGSIDGAVAHWQGSPAVRKRLEAIGRSRHSLVLLLEHVPHTLGRWLSQHRENTAPAGTGSAYLWAEEALARATAFMGSRGFVHFDAHFDNLLTEGRMIYFTDFGLALSSGFELSAAEEQFLSRHLTYDGHYTASHLLHHLLEGLRGGTEREVFLQEWSAGRRPGAVGPELAALIERHARTTLVLDAFHRRLLTQSKRTPFPAAELDRAAAAQEAHG
ncbi:BUD32 family EKC/KEOPS complex subunit [Nocardiopsis xinjiangensis]|uniref:serine/threonine protein kinase n=1 Tax=Nocardiopsis xinjiangensis TaxID=124285 RepID=UPI000345A783|nr:serine/threonine protein kinase [Nocardiopsis xinjiangensis]